jgi:hypothetical protein
MKFYYTIAIKVYDMCCSETKSVTLYEIVDNVPKILFSDDYDINLCPINIIMDWLYEKGYDTKTVSLTKL